MLKATIADLVATIRSARPVPLPSREEWERQRQPLPHALLQRLFVNEVAQRDVLGNQAHGVDQDALIAVLTPADPARDEVRDFGMQGLSSE